MGQQVMNRQIAIIGSGGNLYNLGGKDPRKPLDEILMQLESAGLSCGALQFIAPRSLWMQPKIQRLPRFTAGAFLKGAGRHCRGTLQQVNQAAERLDREIAEQIELGEIDGIIVMSADPEGSNRHAIEAAAKFRLPVTGTGGTSMAIIQTKGAHVIAASGTTGTTNRTRAVTFVTSLSKHWRLTYRPVIGNATANLHGASGSSSPWRRINIRGIMMASLPGFIGMALILAVSKIPGYPR